jgi:DNA-binding GntR family transcriptional regulator
MEISITRDSSAPLHEQLLNPVRHFILAGVWTPKDLLPSESELSRQLKTNRRTVRQALGNAEVQGMQLAVPDATSSDRQARRVRRQGT